MGFAFVKLVLLLLIAFVLGASVGWWLRSRREPGRSFSSGWQGHSLPARQPSGPASGRPDVTPPPVVTRPSPAPFPRTPAPSPAPAPSLAAAPDDLKRIRGVGPALERTLNGLGVTQFAQIAGWTEADVERVDGQLRFRGRIVRDDWIGQAKRLMASGS